MNEQIVTPRPFYKKAINIVLIMFGLGVLVVGVWLYSFFAKLDTGTTSFPYKSRSISAGDNFSNKLLYYGSGGTYMSDADGDNIVRIFKSEFMRRGFLAVNPATKKIYVQEYGKTEYVKATGVDLPYEQTTYSVLEQNIGSNDSALLFSFTPFRSIGPSVIHSPDFKSIAYRDAGDLILYSITDKNTRTLLGDGCSIQKPKSCYMYSPLAWSDDGRNLLVTRYSDDSRNEKSVLFVINPYSNPITTRQLPFYTYFQQLIRWLPNGSGILAWVDNKLILYDMNSGNSKDLTRAEWQIEADKFYNRFPIQILDVSPDSTQVALVLTKETGTTSKIEKINKELIILNLSDNSAKTLFTRSAEAYYDYMGDFRDQIGIMALWGADSKHLYITGARNNDETIILDLTTGKEKNTNLAVGGFIEFLK